MFKRLSTQFIINTLLVMLLSSLLSFVLTNMYYHVTLKPKNDERITKILQSQKQFIEQHPEIKAHDFFTQLGQLNFQVMTIHQSQKQFYGTSFRKDNLAADVLNDNNYHGIKHRPFNVFITGFFDNETENTVGTKMKINGETYHVFMRPDIGQSMKELRIFLAWLLLLTIIFSVLFVFLSSHMIVSPIVKLKRIAQQIGQGDYHVTSAVRRRDEIGTLAREMESMSSSIKAHEEMNQRFVANVSHEIQSPIANLLGQLEQLEHTKDWTLIEPIKHQSMRLSGLTKQLLLLASVEQSGQQLQRETFDGRKLLQEVIRSYSYQLDNKELFVVTKLDDIAMNGNRDLLFQAVANLLSNAIKFSNPGGMIQIRLYQKESIVIEIEDEGRGMTEEVKNHLFERFYKAGSSEDAIPSNGLGLSIVKEIIELHHGEIHVESVEGSGTKFIIELPINS